MVNYLVELLTKYRMTILTTMLMVAFFVVILTVMTKKFKTVIKTTAIFLSPLVVIFSLLVLNKQKVIILSESLLDLLKVPFKFIIELVDIFNRQEDNLSLMITVLVLCSSLFGIFLYCLNYKIRINNQLIIEESTDNKKYSKDNKFIYKTLNYNVNLMRC